MKKITLFIALLMCLNIFAQSKVVKQVEALVAAQTNFHEVNVLTASGPAGTEYKRALDEASFAKLDQAGLNEVVNNRYAHIELSVPYLNGVVTMLLYKVDITAEGFHVDTDQANDVSYSEGVHYRGIVKGKSNSLASFSFFSDEVAGMASLESGNIVVGKVQKQGNKSEYIIYSDDKLKIAPNFQCSAPEGNDDHEEHKGNGNVTQGEASIKCVRMYLEVDHNIYQQNGSNVFTATNWVSSVFNNIQTLYANDGITVALKSIYIWTTPDPYTGGSSYDYREMFAQVRPNFDGDVGQLIGIDPGGLGGIAATIGGICTTLKYAYSDVDFGFSTVPTFSWTVQVITHEFGHVLGSRHTHSCIWNGNNTAIDNCGPSDVGVGSEGYECMTNPPTIPSTSVKGTIMSYCHLINGVGISFLNGFGNQPRQAILNHVNNSACLTTNCLGACVNNIHSINVGNLTANSATINWSDTNNTASWSVTVRKLDDEFAFAENATTTTFPATDLLPNTYYLAIIQPNCNQGLQTSSSEILFMTPGDFCSGITFTDPGGASGDYGNSQSFVRTIMPNQPNKRIKALFNSFNLESGNDFLRVYNGPNTSSPDISAGGFTGTNVPAEILSTAPDGSLTFKFDSDASTVASGWNITISCEDALGIEDSNATVFTYYPNPTTDYVTIEAGVNMTEVLVFNIEGRLLHRSTVNSTDTRVNLSGYSAGTYFFKVKFDGKESNFKILKM